MTPEQCRQARHLLGWSASELARHAGAAQRTVLNFESGSGVTRASTLNLLRVTLERAGIEICPPETEADDQRAVGVILSDGSVVRLRGSQR